MPLSQLTFAAIVASPVVGSFLGVLIERVPAGRPFAWGRSYCDACGHVLGPVDLVPFASWALTRGRCRHCGARLSVFYPLIEFAAVAVAVWSALLASGWRFLASCAMGWAFLVIAVIAWRKRRSVIVPGLAIAIWLVWLYAV